MASAKDISVTVTMSDLVEARTLRRNPWNTNVVSPENEKKIEASLTRLGWFKPITVRTLDDGSHEILGGQHRWEAAVRLGHEKVPIYNVGRVSDERAKEIGLADNARYGEDDSFALAGLLKELGIDELQTFLPFDQAELDSIFTASSIAMNDMNLEPDTPPPDLSPKPNATHQVMRFSVPVEDVAWVTSVIERRMRDKNFSTEDSQTNAGNAFVDLMKEHR